MQIIWSVWDVNVPESPESSFLPSWTLTSALPVITRFTPSLSHWSEMKCLVGPEQSDWMFVLLPLNTHCQSWQIALGGRAEPETLHGFKSAACQRPGIWELVSGFIICYLKTSYSLIVKRPTDGCDRKQNLNYCVKFWCIKQELVLLNKAD